MKKIIIIIISLLINVSFGQDFKYKENQYDLKIYNYLVEQTDNDSISFSRFLFNTKPFSKWDIRPLKNEKVWAMDTIYSASEIPNFIFGSFTKQYGLTQKEALEKPNLFLKKGENKKIELNDFLKKNIKEFNELTKLLLKTKNFIFLNQNSIQRIDEIFKVNEIYWSYLIPKDSPYPISTEITIKKNIKFSNKQNKILNLIKELKIYSTVKTNEGIFFIVDGLTDNSYGFYFTQNNKIETDNFLFEIMKSEKINNNYFYYIAN